MKLSTAANSLYKQYEEAIYKIKKQDDLIKDLKENNKQNEKMIKSFDKLVSSSENNNQLIKKLDNTIKTLSENLQDKDELIAKLLLEIDRLKNQINKDSSNSSKPGSSDIKPPKSGANLYNGRKKSGKKRDINPYTAIRNVYLKKPCFQ